VTGLRERGAREVPAWLARLNTGGLLYGTIVCASALTLGAGKGETEATLIEAMASTLVIYWLAHVYTATVSDREPGDGATLRHRIASSARREATILLGGLPALLTEIALSLAGVTIWVSVLSAVSVAIAMLVVDGVLAGMCAGVGGWRLGAEGASAALFGCLIALLLVFLHTH
jgi:hypothetical protein